MKLIRFPEPAPGSEPESELLAEFGGARLVRLRSGRVELRGGTRADRGSAREWISMFLHEAVIEVGLAA